MQHFFEGDYPQASVDSFFVTIVLCTFYQMTLAGCNNSMITLSWLFNDPTQPTAISSCSEKPSEAFVLKIVKL